MRQLSLNFQTLYADLAQSLALADDKAGSVSVRSIKGRKYLYVTSKDGGERRQRSLGPADDPAAHAESERIRHAAARAAVRRSTVAALKRARVPAPSLALGRVIEVLVNAGLFARGVTLIGTAAYQTYSGVLGCYLPGAAIMTNDADLLVASLVAGNGTQDLEAILQRADPSFRPVMSIGDKLPKVFRSDDGFQVDIVTRFGRGRASPVLVEALACSAEALPFMEYLAEESTEAVVLYNSGLLVRVPPPLRFALHKLLVAQERRGLHAAKKAKDLAQAGDLIDIFAQRDPDALADELAAVRRRGPRWRASIDASMKEIDRNRA